MSTDPDYSNRRAHGERFGIDIEAANLSVVETANTSNRHSATLPLDPLSRASQLEYLRRLNCSPHLRDHCAYPIAIFQASAP